MSTYHRAPKEVETLASEILTANPCYRDVLNARVTFDYIFAHGDCNRDGERVGVAIKKDGVRALGIARVTPLKQRAKGCADAEIVLDGDWWQEEASPEQQAALLDHELFHVELKLDRDGGVRTDDLQRPLLKLKPHDWEMGMFNAIAARHGTASQEVILAKAMMEENGQLYWADLFEVPA